MSGTKKRKGSWLGPTLPLGAGMIWLIIQAVRAFSGVILARPSGGFSDAQREMIIRDTMWMVAPPVVLIVIGIVWHIVRAILRKRRPQEVAEEAE